jgi:protein-disulfide isomerase
MTENLSNHDDSDGTPTPSRKQSKAQARAEALARLRAQERARRRRRTLWQVVAGVVVVALVVGGAVLVLSNQDDDATTAAAAPDVVPQAVSKDGGFVVGDPDAKVTVQVVEDFQCPICKQFEAAAGDLLDQYAAGTDVKVEYRGIAFLDRASSTRYSSRALNASACVMPSGTEVWKEFHRQLYLQQPAEGGDGLTDDEITSIAVAAGADEDAVSSCVADEQYGDWVTATTNRAFDEDGVTGTPTLFVDGKKLSGFDPATLQAAVDQALGS